MKILTSANVADLMNIMLKNVRGTTTTTDGAESDGLIVSENLENLVDGGRELTNSLTMENFKNVVTGMLEGVGRILYENVKATSPTRFNLAIDESAFLSIVEKVRISSIDFEESYIYETSGGSSFADMFNNHPLTFSVKVWNTVGSYRTKPYTISMEQLRTSVNSETEFTRLLGQIYNLIEVTYMTAIRSAETRVVMNQIANCCMYRNGQLVVDVLAEFKKETGTSLTTETMHNSDAFKRWFYGFVKHLKSLMGEQTGNFNTEKNLINTDGEDMRFFIMEKFATSLATISKTAENSTKFNALDNATEIVFIQNINEPNKISVKPCESPVITSGKHVTNVTVDNIVGMIWDRRGTMVSASKIKTGVVKNEFDDWTNTVHNFKIREMCDKGSNAIVLVANDSTGTNKAYTITEEND